jgi:hypothetical protein
MDYRRHLLTQICKARKEYFRLKAEITALMPCLPTGTYLSTYTSNSKASKCEHYELAPYIYHVLAHKEGLLPSAKKENKPTYKHHLGRIHNERYLKGVLAIERMQIAKIKLETLNRVSAYLSEIKQMYKEYKLKSKRIKALIDADVAANEEIYTDTLDKFLQ